MIKRSKPLSPDTPTGDAGTSWKEGADQRLTAAIEEIVRKNQDKVWDDLTDEPEDWEISNMDLTQEDIEAEDELARYRGLF